MEYKVLRYTQNLESEMTRLARDGWRFVAMEANVVIMQRETGQDA